MNVAHVLVEFLKLGKKNNRNFSENSIAVFFNSSWSLLRPAHETLPTRVPPISEAPPQFKGWRWHGFLGRRILMEGCVAEKSWKLLHQLLQKRTLNGVPHFQHLESILRTNLLQRIARFDGISSWPAARRSWHRRSAPTSWRLSWENSCLGEKRINRRVETSDTPLQVSDCIFDI